MGEADPSKNDLQRSDMFVSDDIESNFWISCIWSRLGLEVSLEKLGTKRRAVLRFSNSSRGILVSCRIVRRVEEWDRHVDGLKRTSG